MVFHIKGTNVRLIGTTHASRADPSSYPPAWLKEQFHRSHSFVFESDQVENFDPKIFLAPKGQSPKKLPFYIRLKCLWERQRITDNLNRLKYWRANALLHGSLTANTGPGIESLYLPLVKKKNLPVLFFETQAEAIAAEDKAPLREQIAQLKRTVDTADESPDIDLDRLWMDGDLDAMRAWLETARERYPETHKLSLDYRNEAWMPKLLQIVAANPQNPFAAQVLVAVGVFHLCGKGSLLDLLGRQGYTVTPLL